MAALGLLLWRQGTVSIVTGAWLPEWLGFFRAAPLTLIQVVLLAYAVLWIVLTIDTLRLVRLVKTGAVARFGILGLAVALLVASTSGAVYASQIAGTTRDTLGSIFGASGPSVPPSDGYYNILLLGADSGEGRDSMRFDSISVVSVNATTGATTITGIPRDMPNAPFSAGPMQDICSLPDMEATACTPEGVRDAMPMSPPRGTVMTTMGAFRGPPYDSHWPSQASSLRDTTRTHQNQGEPEPSSGPRSIRSKPSSI